jgi:hypothetical protein
MVDRRIARSAIAALSVFLASPVCRPTLSDSAAIEPSRPPSQASSKLNLSLTAYPVRVTAGSQVLFTLTMKDKHAVGALGYEVAFGDGASRTIAVPQYCLLPPGIPAKTTWRFVHRYSKPGSYRATAHGYVNCTSTHATQATTIIVTA